MNKHNEELIKLNSTLKDALILKKPNYDNGCSIISIVGTGPFGMDGLYTKGMMKELVAQFTSVKRF